MNDKLDSDPRLYAIPDIHGHAKGEHKAFSDERPIPLSARMLFLWFYHACRRGWPRFLMVTDHMNYLTFEDPAAINLVRRALKLAQAGDLYGAAETASVEVGHAAVVSEGLRRGMRYSIGAEVDNDPRSRPDAQNIVDAMKPDGMIRSVHFLAIDHPTHGPNWNWPFDNPEFADVHDLIGTQKTWELYMATLLDAIERLPGDIVGHFYVPALFGHWPDDATLDGYENALVDACEARGMAIEFNTRFLYRNHSADEKANYLRAHRRLLAKCKAKNVGIAVGSDAHSPKDQGGAFATVLAVLDECEINELVFPLAGRLARVALRVERKIEPAAELAPAVPPEERKSARKARPAEPSDREVAAPAVVPDEIALEAPKPKPRPKRVRAKPATTAELGVGSADGDDGVPAAGLDPVIESDAISPGADAESHVTVTSHSTTIETHWRSETNSRVETHAQVMVPAGLVVTESLVSEAVEEMVTEAEIEPIVLTAEADTLVADAAEADTPVADAAEAAGGDAAPAPDDLMPGQPDEFVPAQVDEFMSVQLDESALAQPLAEGEESVVEGPDADTPASTDPGPKPPSRARAARARAVSLVGKPAPKKAIKPAAKAAAKKAAPPKAAAKKTAVPKLSAKKATPKKVAAKKAPSKKAAVRTPGAKKASAKKAIAKKATPKKPAQRRR